MGKNDEFGGRGRTKIRQQSFFLKMATTLPISKQSCVREGDDVFFPLGDNEKDADVLRVFNLGTIEQNETRILHLEGTPASGPDDVPWTLHWTEGMWSAESTSTINTPIDLFVLGPRLVVSPDAKINCTNGQTSIVVPREFPAMGNIQGFKHIVTYDPQTLELCAPCPLSARWARETKTILLSIAAPNGRERR